MPGTEPSTEHAKRDHLMLYFLSAPQDQDACVAVHDFLSPVIRNSTIPLQIYSDYTIPAGEDVDKYKEKLYEADIVLAFGSKDFIANDDTYQRTQKVIVRYNNNQTVLLAILVRNFFWDMPPFSKLTILPKNKQPIKNLRFWNSEDDAFTAVVEELYQIISELVCEPPVEGAMDAGTPTVNT